MSGDLTPAIVGGVGEAARLCRLYDITDEDIARIRGYGEHVMPRIDDFISQFYEWMGELPEFDEYFSDAARLSSVQTLQRNYWQAFFACEVDDAYVIGRRRVGEAHARIGLSLETYLAAMSRSLDLLTTTFHDRQLEASQHAAAMASLTRLLHLDTSVVAATFAARTQSLIAEQSETLIQMSTPVTEIWDGILLLPIVGIVDSNRSRDMMNSMLTRIGNTRARSIILDISGVAVVDTAVANHLIKITKATMLMGCECTFSGISPAIAQTIVELGIEVGDIHTTATLGAALEYAFRRTGVDIRRATS